ncbi:hypothetical protein HMPREF1020_03839 [Clostridium sp. 7_3_54FAA]|nr:hypothetical protein HMPREF1020_03839 [Clostridium sp. 7_3_54FAA]
MKRKREKIELERMGAIFSKDVDKCRQRVKMGECVYCSRPGLEKGAGERCKANDARPGDGKVYPSRDPGLRDIRYIRADSSAAARWAEIH